MHRKTYKAQRDNGNERVVINPFAAGQEAFMSAQLLETFVLNIEITRAGHTLLTELREQL